MAEEESYDDEEGHEEESYEGRRQNPQGTYLVLIISWVCSSSLETFK